VPRSGLTRLAAATETSSNQNIMLTWSEEFATGSALVDTQHRMLIEKINKLEQLLGGPPPTKGVYDELLDFLGSYVGTHFKYEEQCMARYHCPAHAQNQQAHAAFLGVFGKFKEKYLAEGPQPQLLKNLQVSASDWIKQHILTVDIQLKACIKA
jgi:hemerythrin-like metal-binding protein